MVLIFCVVIDLVNGEEKNSLFSHACVCIISQVYIVNCVFGSCNKVTYQVVCFTEIFAV